MAPAADRGTALTMGPAGQAGRGPPAGTTAPVYPPFPAAGYEALGQPYGPYGPYGACAAPPSPEGAFTCIPAPVCAPPEGYQVLARPDGSYVLIAEGGKGPEPAPRPAGSGTTWAWITFCIGCLVPPVLWVLCCALAGQRGDPRYRAVRTATRVAAAVYAALLLVGVLLVTLMSSIIVSA